jgi:hypothetical protein
MSQLVRFSCAGCRQELRMDAAWCGRPVTCPCCSTALVVRTTPPAEGRDDEVPRRLTLPQGLGFQAKVSRETANSDAKVLTRALCTARGVVVAVLVGTRPTVRG